MVRTKKLSQAIGMLKKNCGVIPEQYTIYNGAYLFMAYPPGIEDKTRYMSPWYLVDPKLKAAGPFSPAFDIEGFAKATEKLKRI